MRVDQHLLKLGNLFKRRNDDYGNSYHSFGKIMESFFPDGIKLEGEQDFGRFAILNILIGKMHRYGNNFHKNGHADSLDDISVYAAMLQDLDDGVKPEKLHDFLTGKEVEGWDVSKIDGVKDD